MDGGPGEQGLQVGGDYREISSREIGLDVNLRDMAERRHGRWKGAVESRGKEWPKQSLETIRAGQKKYWW